MNPSVEILLELKDVFSKVGDNKDFSTANNLIKKIGYKDASREEIKEIFSKYGNSK